MELWKAPLKVYEACAVRFGQLVLSNLYTKLCYQAAVAPRKSRDDRAGFPPFACAARSPTRRLVRGYGPHGPPVLPRNRAAEPPPPDPNGNATSLTMMDEVFFGECPDTKGQPPDAALQPGSELERTARPSGTERGRT